MKTASLALLSLSLCVAVASPAVLPAATTPVQPLSKGADMQIQVVLPGKLSGLQAQPVETEAFKPVTFKFLGTGHCRVALNTGDGSVTEFEGDLPFTGNYTYSTNAMLSYEAFKDFTATAKPLGSCKLVGTASVSVRIKNPNPQPLNGSTSNPPVVVKVPLKVK